MGVWLAFGSVVHGGEAPADGGAGARIEFARHVVDPALTSFGADIGDRGKDRKADIVALDRSRIYWYRDGERHLIDSLEEPALLIHLRTADLDWDGDRDVVAADHRNGRLLFYENPGPEGKTRPWPRHVIDDQMKGAHAVALGDIDGDGRVDVVASGESEASPPDSVCWFRNPGRPGDAWTKHPLGLGQAGGLAHYPALGDVNGDGRLDVVHAAKEGDWYRMWLQTDFPRDPWQFIQVGREYDWATNIQPGDVNGDGRVDLVATQGHASGVWWFEAPNWVPHAMDDQLKSPHTLAVADLDGDGDLDAATCAFESRVLAWFENDGRGGFTRRDIAQDQAAYDLAARDVDGDLDLDLLVAGQNSGNVVWHETRASVDSAAGSNARSGDSKRLRVMSYNIHHGEGVDGEIDLHRISQLILNGNPDLVALQEVDRGVRRTDGRDFPAELAELTGMTPVFRNNYSYQGGEYGNAILSRFPVLETSNTHYEMLRPGEQRGLLRAVVDAEGRRLVFMSTHLDFRPDDAERLSNVAEILDAAGHEGNSAIVLCGDFNDTPESATHARLEEYFTDCWTASGAGSGFTIPSVEPKKRIDFVFVSSGSPLRPVRAWVPRSLASDHLPVAAELEWTD